MRNRAERRAVVHYLLRGYRILGTNVWAAGNEVDVIARRGRRIVFCEVKSKSGTRFGDPLDMVTAEKRRRVERAAQVWMASHPKLAGLDVRFDVVADRAGKLERLEQAW